MALLRYLAILVPAVAALAAFKLIFSFPALVIPIVIGWSVLSLTAHYFLGGKEARSAAHWRFAVPPAMIFIAAAAYSLLIESAVFRPLLAVGVSALLFVVYWNIYLFYYQPLRYQANALEHLSMLGNLLAVYFGAVSLFGLRLFLGLHAWEIALAVVVGSALLVEQSFWVSKLPFDRTRPYVFLLPFLLLELAAALFILPLTHTVSGAIFTIVYYVLLGITRGILRGTYSPGTAKKYAVIAATGLVLVLATARWS